MMTGQAKVDAAQLRPPFGGDAPMIATGDARAEGAHPLGPRTQR